MKRGVYPGSFNPPTLGHIAIVRASIQQFSLDQIDLAISEIPLAKPVVEKPSLEERIRVLETSVADIPQSQVIRTQLQLIADIADGYDVVVMGADKWAQIHDKSFYDDDIHMRSCLSRLPELAVAPRDGIDVPKEILLDVPKMIASISSSIAREEMFEWMTEAAQSFSIATGAWKN